MRMPGRDLHKSEIQRSAWPWLPLPALPMWTSSSELAAPHSIRRNHRITAPAAKKTPFQASHPINP